MAIKVGLPKTTLMVNDIEDSKLKENNNHTANSLAFEKQLVELGFKKVNHYIVLHWINEKNRSS